MNTNEFLQIAREKISNDPRTRLTAPTKAALADPNCLIDVHTHIFDRKSLNVPYILLRMAKSGLGLETAGLLGKTEAEIYADIKNKKLNKNADWEELEAELEMMESVELFGMEITDALKVLRKANMQEILDLYLEKFAIINLPEFSNHSFVTGVLLMDLETGWEMKSNKKYFEQVEEVREISKVRPILPFFAVDPRRADETDPNKNLYDLFIKAFVNEEAPYFGVKCYPSLGYLPSDVRLDPIFQICEEKNIPVLTHCGGETVSTFRKKIPVRSSTGDIMFTIPGNTRTERAIWLNNPAHWDMVLEKHKNLKLNLAHFGGDTNWEEMGTGSNERVEKIIDMMRNPEWKVYTDFSFNVVEDELYNAFQNQLDNNTDIAARTLYGTDYWVVLPKGDLLEKQDRFLNQMINHQTTLLQSVPREFLGI